MEITQTGPFQFAKNAICPKLYFCLIKHWCPLLNIVSDDVLNTHKNTTQLRVYMNIAVHLISDEE